jgi:hypothetical protein
MAHELTAEIRADIQGQAGQSAQVLESLDRIEQVLALTRSARKPTTE